MNTNKTSAFARSHQTSPRPSRLSALFLLGTLLALGVPLNTQAQTLYWDISGATAGAGGAPPSRNWDATANWTTNAAGTSATQAWTSGRPAVFSAGTDATGAYTITLIGTQTASGITFEEGVVTLSGGTLALTGSSISVNAAPTKAIISSVISGSSGLTKQNAGELVLAGANTFSGNLSFLAGTLTLNNNAAASTGSIVFNPSVGATAVLTSTNTAVTIANNITLGGTSLTPLEIDAATNSSITLNGVLSGGHSWAANGPGTLYLGGLVANYFAGAFVVRQGTVVVTADGALGSTANGSQVNAGATLALDGNVSYYTAESLTINGRGVNNLGALQGLSGLNYFYGPITFGSDTTIGAQAGSYLGLGASLFSSGTENLTITNSGTVIMSGLNNNYSNTLVSAGVLEVDYPANAGYGLVTVSTNATLSGGDGSAPGGIDLSGILAPSGTFSSGTQTWNGGGKYVWEILDATNAPVNDLLNISGSLNINATSGDKFTVVVASLDPNSYLPGPVGNFNNTLEYQWVIASATNTISTFIAAKFAVDATDFAIQNDMGGGSFRILASGTNLLMEFDPAPVIICPGSVVVDNTLNLCSASVAFAAIATNYADLSPVTIVYTNNGVPITSPNVFPGGTFTTGEATAIDSVGNTATCSFTVTVNDTQNPTPVTQNISVNLSGNTVSVAATAINNGSTDNCSIANYLISKDGGATYAPSVSFGCGETGAQPVKLKVVDASGLFATADATVTVNDVTAPTALAQNITVYLNNLGSVSVAASAINNSSSDNCTITYLQISKDGGATY